MLQHALELDPANTDYLIEGGYQALMAGKINDAIKFYKNAAKTQSENLGAVYGLLAQWNINDQFHIEQYL